MAVAGEGSGDVEENVKPPLPQRLEKSRELRRLIDHDIVAGRHLERLPPTVGAAARVRGIERGLREDRRPNVDLRADGLVRVAHPQRFSVALRRMWCELAVHPRHVVRVDLEVRRRWRWNRRNRQWTRGGVAKHGPRLPIQWHGRVQIDDRGNALSYPLGDSGDDHAAVGTVSY